MPIINVPLNYKISRTLKYIQVKKIILEGRKIKVQMYIQNSCGFETYKKITPVTDVEDFIQLKIPFDSGRYKVRVISLDLDETFVYEEYSFESYKHLLSNLVWALKDTLCDCHCTNCKDCVDCNEEKKPDNLVTKLLSFYLLNHSHYSPIVNMGSSCIECKLMEDINCLVLNDFIISTSEEKSLLKRIYSYFYIIFYLGEKALYSYCPDEVDDLFEIDIIKPCLDTINVECIIEKVTNNSDYVVSDSDLKLL